MVRNHIWQQWTQSKQRNSLKVSVSKRGRPLSVCVHALCATVTHFHPLLTSVLPSCPYSHPPNTHSLSRLLTEGLTLQDTVNNPTQEVTEPGGDQGVWHRRLWLEPHHKHTNSTLSLFPCFSLQENSQMDHYLTRCLEITFCVALLCV